MRCHIKGERETVCRLTTALVFSLAIFVSGCKSEPVKDFSFVEEAIFPLPVTEWSDVQEVHVRIIKFDCSFDVYVAWLIQLEGYQEMVGIEERDDLSERQKELVDYLARKKPGNDYQGMYVGVDWRKDDESPPVILQISSHAYHPGIVSVEIASSHL